MILERAIFLLGSAFRLGGCHVGRGSGIVIRLGLCQGGRSGNVIRPAIINDNFRFIPLLRKPGCESCTDCGLVLLVCQGTDLVTKYLNDVIAAGGFYRLAGLANFKREGRSYDFRGYGSRIASKPSHIPAIGLGTCIDGIFGCQGGKITTGRDKLCKDSLGGRLI